MRSFTNTTIARAETSICFGSSAPSTTLPLARLDTDIRDAGSPMRQPSAAPDVIVAVATPQNPNDIVPSPQPHAARAACSAPKAKPPTATRVIKKPETGELVTQASNAKRARTIADTIMDLAAQGDQLGVCQIATHIVFNKTRLSEFFWYYCCTQVHASILLDATATTDCHASWTRRLITLLELPAGSTVASSNGDPFPVKPSPATPDLQAAAGESTTNDSATGVSDLPAAGRAEVPPAANAANWVVAIAAAAEAVEDIRPDIAEAAVPSVHTQLNVPAAAPVLEAAAWPELQDLDDTNPVGDFPWEACMPLIEADVATYIQQTSEALAIEPVVVLQLVLSAAGMITMGRVRIEGAPGHIEPLVVWTMAFLPPGARKTPLMAQITADIPAVGLQNTRLLNDVTAAGLRDALVDQEHALVGIWSAEGNVLRQASVSAPLREMLLKFYAGEPMQVARGGISGTVQELSHPLATIGILAQPILLTDALANNAVQQSGLLDRILFTCMHRVQRLKYGTTPQVVEQVRRAFSERLQHIADLPLPAQGDPMQLAPEAFEAVLGIDSELNNLSQGAWGQLGGFTSKSITHVLRLAGILHLFGHHPQEAVTAQSIQAAWLLVQHAAHHRIALLGITPQGNDQRRLARKLLNWAAHRNLDRFAASKAHQDLREDAAWLRRDWDPVFALLTETGHIRPTTLKGTGAQGGAPVQGFLVNPAVC
jgi:hypothetical protein